jgi:hypothetical protein
MREYKVIETSNSGLMKVKCTRMIDLLAESEKKDGYADKVPPQPPLTKGRFEALLAKAAQPLKPETKEK